MGLPLIGPLLEIGGKLIDKLIPDPGARDKARLELFNMAQAGELQDLGIRANIITTEAQSESWLTRSWRPITMLTFVALVVAHWLGFTAPNISEEQVLGLLDIVQIGLGGYVVGRSLEKTAEVLAPALAKKL